MTKVRYNKENDNTWIETVCVGGYIGSVRSLASRGRGLKLLGQYHLVAVSLVAPLTGAWIETLVGTRLRSPGRSRSLTGAWIETFL